MNICVDCRYCSQINDRPECLHLHVKSGASLDCRLYNPEGKCQWYERGGPAAPPKPIVPDTHHFGDPCQKCGTPHDEVAPGPCPGVPQRTPIILTNTPIEPAETQLLAMVMGQGLPAEPADDNKKLRQLASFLKTAKHEEELAKQARIKVEEEIAALVPGPESGQKTIDLGDGVKITVERGFNYKADIPEIDKVFSGMPNLGHAPIKTKTTRELDVKGYEWYRENHTEVFYEFARYVAVMPKKTAVSVKGL